MATHLMTRVFQIAAVLLLVLAGASPVWSQSEQGFVKQGGFAGVSFVPNFTFDGVTFDGETIYK